MKLRNLTFVVTLLAVSLMGLAGCSQGKSSGVPPITGTRVQQDGSQGGPPNLPGISVHRPVPTPTP